MLNKGKITGVMQASYILCSLVQLMGEGGGGRFFRRGH